MKTLSSSGKTSGYDWKTVVRFYTGLHLLTAVNDLTFTEKN